MLLANQLHHVLGQTSKIWILNYLIKADAECNGREIALAIGLSHVKCHTALKELNQYGVVEMRRVGRSILYRLNLKSVLVKKVLIPLFEKVEQLKESLGKIISKHLTHPKPKSVIMFGSFATSRAKPNSDIDIMVIASHKKDIPILKEGLDETEIEITTGFGNHLAPIIMDAMEFKKRFRNRDKLVRNIAKEGKVLSGASINDLITQ